MAQLWRQSNVRIEDASNLPIVGAQAFFYNEETSTPQPVYTTAALDIAHDQPVLSNSLGRFPAVFLNPTPGTYRERVLDDADVELWDIDGISVPQDADFVPPDTGDTSETLLFRTGDMKARYATGTHSGWVRGNARTIGSATSGATERANADCEDLFLHLWTQDANLPVSGGRGGSAAGDWAANKTITLPDLRDRVLIGLGDMGNSDANRIADSLTDDDNITLGATAGASTVALTEAQLAAHDHDATFTGTALAGHTHTLTADGNKYGTNGADPGGAFNVASGDSGNGAWDPISQATSSSSAGTPAGTIDVADAGSGQGHPNIQPGMFVTIYIKL